MCGQMHVVLEGYDPSCDDDEHRHILSLKKGEKVEVLAKDVSGMQTLTCRKNEVFDDRQTKIIPVSSNAQK